VFDIFLVHNGALFELSVRGEVTGAASAESLAASLGHLPEGCSALLDLTQVTALDDTALDAIRQAVTERKPTDLSVAIPAGDDIARERWERAAGSGPARLFTTLSVPRRPAVTLSST
jgi:hypothetical protein